ncbi:pentapeptide repeat-containing protein [Aestuariibaculum sediminum]|uniref:Pentapeptide repeat-containing protein n=1 Tax=Aestuariibaculum sediminum TaxID=2770637 RepID=A0A8J6Q244_9FLAO|nr:pentapeptide repeat-containing protein [Aestuariibaculum sediminum]MBD0833362.1 pentapeptide repeat-containing protein [Aestuariibaculum sediminum]
MREINTLLELQTLNGQQVRAGNGYTWHGEYSNLIINFSLELNPPIQNIKFHNCIFKEDFFIKRTVQGKLYINDCTFEKDFDISGAVFPQKVRFQKNEYKGLALFNNTVFNDLVDFWGSTFHKRTIFYKTNFLGILVLSSVTFNENLLFTYTLVEKMMILRGISLKKGLDLSLSIITGEVGIYDFKLSNFDSENIQSDTEHFQICVSRTGEIPTKNKRETFRIIKEKFLKVHNVIESLTYESLEKQAHSQYMKESRVVFFSNDRLIFLFNNWSNKHRSSFKQGIKFTFIVAVVTYFLSIVTSGNFTLTLDDFWGNLFQNIKGFILTLNPIHRISNLKEIYEIDDFGLAFYVFNYIGRVLVGYGTYQTIQAFRKYR